MNPLNLDLFQWGLAIFCGLLIGFSKTGLSGAGTLMVPIMAAIFGGKASSGIVLPMLIFGDLIAVKKYNQHAEWKYIIRLLPWALAGIILGVFIGNKIDDFIFKKMLAGIIIIGLAIMIWQERKGEDAAIPHQWWFMAIIGLAGGFTTMVGNAAGPVMTIYLLSMQLPKYAFIGTGAWFFMIINWTKVPFQIFFWKGITPETLIFNATLVPAIVLGAITGIIVVKRIPEKPFRYVVIALTAVAALKLFF